MILGPLQKNWIKKLRSGYYKQGSSRLRNCDDEYCCLGVAADVLVENQIGEWVHNLPEQDVWFKLHREEVGRTGFLQGWEEIGLKSNNGGYSKSLLSDDHYMRKFKSLTMANDSGITFEQIADFLETYPEAVFKESK